MDDKFQADIKVRRQHIAMGMPLVAVGSSMQILAGSVHALIPQMVVRGISILMLIAGIVINVRGILKGREARMGKGR